MAKVLIDDSYLEDIADSIRAKNGTEDTYKPKEMSTAIDELPSGGEKVTLPNGLKFGNIQSTSTTWDWLEDVDTSEVTNMSSMFANLTNNITVAPYMDTSNVTNTSSMFSFCLNIVSVPQYDLSKVTDAQGMFRYCSKLENVPVFNLSSITYWASNMNIFADCPKLTNESLNNILLTCISMTGIGTAYKTLQQIGLTQTQAETCQTLSNYQVFLDAGWTTGY